MSFFQDMGTTSMLAAGEYVRAIGWLHPDHPYTKGEVSGEFLARLKEFVARSGKSAEALYLPGACGFHTCEFCGKAWGVANFGVPCDGLLYVVPEMIVHYIEQHGYCPPEEFVTALLRSPLPGTEEYELITEPFWHLHRKAYKQFLAATGANKTSSSGQQPAH